MRNVNSDSIVIVYYPRQAGGKFLINSLGLSNGCYFQDIDCVRLQRNNKFTPKLKLMTLLERIGNNNHSWGDLGLGCRELFGTDSVDTKNFLSDIDLISHENTLFFAIAHELESFEQLNNIWPNAKKIYLTNYATFIEWRNNCQYTRPEDTELLEQHEFLIWDIGSYFDRSQFLTQLETFYSQLGLTDFNQHYAKTYYNKYMEKLTKIREHDISNRSKNQ